MCFTLRLKESLFTLWSLALAKKSGNNINNSHLSFQTVLFLVTMVCCIFFLDKKHQIHFLLNEKFKSKPIMTWFISYEANAFLPIFKNTFVKLNISYIWTEQMFYIRSLAKSFVSLTKKTFEIVSIWKTVY